MSRPKLLPLLLIILVIGIVVMLVCAIRDVAKPADYCAPTAVWLPVAGWHLVSSPIGETVSAGSVGFITTEVPYLCMWEEAAAKGYVAPDMWGYDAKTGSYVRFGFSGTAARSTRCGKGYWLYTYVDGVRLLWRTPPPGPW